jgi:isoquinoline 1-oxidoreductase beta subunit
LDDKGRVSAFAAHGVTFAHGSEVAQAAGIEGNGFETRVVSATRLEQSLIPTIVPTGYLRAPVSNGLAFVRECFWDELALAAGRDPVAFRLAALDNAVDSGGNFDATRMRAVLTRVAARSNWGKARLTNGEGMGVACYFSHSGYFAEVARVRVDTDGQWRVLNVWVAGDIGHQVVNPLAARAQVEGAVIDGISSMNAEVTIANGAAVQTNFDAFPLLRMPEAPTVEVEFVTSAAAPTGLGEPALPPVLPAVANAIHAACGARVRQLPLTAARVQAARRV